MSIVPFTFLDKKFKVDVKELFEEIKENRGRSILTALLNPLCIYIIFHDRNDHISSLNFYPHY